MLGSVISRFRVLALLLAFGLGFAGQVLSGAAMAAQMQAAPTRGIATGAICPDCPSDQPGGMSIGCTIAACWTVPALPVQSKIPEFQPRVLFTPSAEVIIAGIAIAPEPHPPRPFLHA
jgi:hypothetical protein